MHTTQHTWTRALGRASAYTILWRRIAWAVGIGIGVAGVVALVAPAQSMIWGAIALSWMLIWQARQELKHELRSHDVQIMRLERMCNALYRRHKHLERSVIDRADTHVAKTAPNTSNHTLYSKPMLWDDHQQHLLERLLARPVEIRE